MHIRHFRKTYCLHVQCKWIWFRCMPKWLERKEYVDYMGNYTHFIFSMSASTCITFSHPSAEGSTFLWNMEHIPTKWWRNLSTITMKTWKIISVEHVERKAGWGGSGFRANVVMLIEKKIPACGKNKTLECQSIFTVWVTPAPEHNDNSWCMEVVVAICY